MKHKIDFYLSSKEDDSEENEVEDDDSEENEVEDDDYGDGEEIVKGR